ncbi:CRISPR-associated ring nuclease Csm6 [Psychrobacter lutiphocae]|uniref:CRISPR-associated ring nuclease Csm6 n=1 Tax=Psychrobacter lutiphocae TaxID=540500 RepID=UPI0003746DF5|nr:CRISPR-associated ring nuclease Csm6 [Psychrobacter lutiphocae]
MKNILFLVTGMTPQIITETVWALACAPDVPEPWIPDEIHVLSTASGLNQIKKRLFEDGVFKQMQQDYPSLAHINFKATDDYLHHIDNNGEVLNDLKTPEENEKAADAIYEKIRQFTSDDNIVLHVSIAGGRKTMGFYAGYALSLFGRAQDSMSHVLVGEEFEKAVDFFYPTPNSYLVSDRDKKVVGDAKDAPVWLAKVNFIRMKEAIKARHQLNTDDSFSDVVQKIDESFKDVKLTINVHNKSVVVNDTMVVEGIPAREFAFLHWFADRKVNGKPGVLKPKHKMTQQNIPKESIDYIAQLTKEFAPYYLEHKIEENPDISMDMGSFEGAQSLLHKRLQESLGLELAAKITISQNAKNQPYQLTLAPEAIQIVDLFSK